LRPTRASCPLAEHPWPSGWNCKSIKGVFWIRFRHGIDIGFSAHAYKRYQSRCSLLRKRFNATLRHSPSQCFGQSQLDLKTMNSWAVLRYTPFAYVFPSSEHTASVTSCVDALPPRSFVITPRSVTASTACIKCFAAASSPSHINISDADQNVPTGLATP
jgi:hypothetical protein